MVAAGAAASWKGGNREGATRWTQLGRPERMSSASGGSMPETRPITWTSRCIRSPRQAWLTSRITRGRKATTRPASPVCARRALTLKKETPYAVVSGISGVVYEICWYMRGLEQWFCDLMGDTQFCEAILDQTLKFGWTGSGCSSTKVGDVVDVIMIGGRSGGPERAAVHPGDLPPHRQAAPQAAGGNTSAPAPRPKSGITRAAPAWI